MRDSPLSMLCGAVGRWLVRERTTPSTLPRLRQHLCNARAYQFGLLVVGPAQNPFAALLNGMACFHFQDKTTNSYRQNNTRRCFDTCNTKTMPIRHLTW